MPLVEQFQYGLDAPICLTWELTYACNLACVHCLSSSGRRDPRELTTAECKAVIDELERMQVFYVNIGGGEPTVRPDFWELVDYAIAHHVGVKFSTNGIKITPERARRLAASDYVDVQISLDGATAEVNDAVRGRGLVRHRAAGDGQPGRRPASGFKISVVMTRQNVDQLDDFKAIADRFGAQLRITRLRPSGRGADVWDELHPTAEPAARSSTTGCSPHGEHVLTGDSFFHLAALRRGAARAEPVRRRPGRLPDRPGRRRLRLPVRDPRQLPGRQRPRPGRLRRGVARLGAVRRAARAADRRRLPSCSAYDACQGGCMAAKFFTGLPLDGPDPECVKGHGERALAAVAGATPRPGRSADHSHRSWPVEPVPADHPTETQPGTGVDWGCATR